MASDKDALNAGLAVALAPVLGETAVYVGGWQCPAGHTSSGTVVTDGSPRCEVWDEERGDMCRRRAELVQLPRALTQSNVLVPIVEALGKNHNLGIMIYRLSEPARPSYWLVCVRWQSNEHRSKGDNLGLVMAEAWLAALTGGTADA